jgi:plastocyanin
MRKGFDYFLRLGSQGRRYLLVFFLVFFVGFVGVFLVNLIVVASTMNTTKTFDNSIVRIIVGGGYSPQEITVVIGVNNTVTWINGDYVSHTITADSGLFDSGNLNAGQEWAYTFSQPGTYSYHCSFHLWTHGVVTVVKSE